jgi:hypothetical protein
MEEGGAFRAQKRYGSKPLSKALKSRARLVPNPTIARGCPLVIKTHSDPEENSFNE